jgi:dTDP-4-amino-4,6-dideoxygalactose transaminase
MDRILEIARRHDLLIIEDAAQALGSRYKDRLAGTFGLAAAISFYPAKILGCFGDGGAVVTNDDAVARHVRLLRDHGRNEDGEVETWGLNSRLDNFQAAVLDFQFKDYATIISHRRAIASVYQDRLGGLPELVLPAAPDSEPDHFDVFQNYEIEADRRNELRDFLKANGVGTLIQWGGKAVHQFTGLGFSQSLPKTERFFERCLMLPMNMMVTADDAAYVADRIRDFYGA